VGKEEKNKKFSEELITYFSLTLHKPNRELKIRGSEGQTLRHRQQGDLISFLTKIRVDTQSDKQTRTDTFRQTAGWCHKPPIVFLE
jgi:hypothetical protein